MLELLKELCNIDAVSGFERNLALIIAEKIKAFCDSLYIDKAGNLIAFKKGKKTPKETVLYCAHLDEVGMVVRHINDDGTLLFEPIGLVTTGLLSKRVRIGDKKIGGVIGSKPIHLIKDKEKGVSFDEMYIDIGCTSGQEAEKSEVFSEYVAFDNEFTVFGGGNYVKTKALDDRAGCAVMIKMIQSELEYDSYFAFTVGEELGGVGAVCAIRETSAKTAFVFEATTAGDMPFNKEEARVCSLNMGPVVPFMDGGTLYDRKLYKNVRELAKKSGIKTQTKTKIAGGTDAASIQRSTCGVRVCAISLACRYIHTPSCVASVSDINACLSLAKLVDKNLESLLCE